MRILHPEWLLLVPILALACWRWKRLGRALQNPRRLACLGLLLLMLLRVEVRRLSDGLDLWVLIDHSDSARDWVEGRASEWRAVLERTRASRDRIRYIHFADDFVLEGGGGELLTMNRGETRTRDAIFFALGQMDRNRANRLLLFTDGYSTQGLEGIGGRLLAEEIPLDYRLVAGPEEKDYQVAAFEAPVRVAPGEPFLLALEAAGKPDGEVPYVLKRDGVVLSEGKIVIREGKGRLAFTDRLGGSGARRYNVELGAESDPLPGNNRADAWVEVAGGGKFLLLSRYSNDPLADVLARQGHEVLQPRTLEELHLGMLAGTRAVLFNNVPAHELPGDFLKALDFYVRHQGGGLAMFGGKNSFGSGGYFESPIDPLLPVSMELRQEHRKLAVAMAIVLDRSGSMAAPAGGGSGGSGALTKMDLANEGAARAISLLGAQDAVAVFAVDSEPHLISGLTQAGPNREKLDRVVRRIHSMGGGIYVYTGLKAAWEELQKAEVGLRHIVLFADAADAEEPGEYQSLLAEITKSGGSVSVIGMGGRQDSDAAFLEDVARRGNGRIFFSQDPSELPALFAQETVAVARSAFLDEAADWVASQGWLQMASSPLPWPKQVDGYNLSYLRPEATAGAFSGDGYEAPLLSFWQRGIGRSAAVSFPIAGDFSEKVRFWSGYGDFLQTLSRWLAGEGVPAGIALRPRLNGSDLELDLFYNESWAQKMAVSPPVLNVSMGVEEKKTASPTWSRMSPGHFRATLEVEAGALVRGAVQIGNQAVAFGPLSRWGGLEWEKSRGRQEELRSLAKLSGGKERLNLGEVWNDRRKERFDDIQEKIAAVLLLLILIDLFWTRWFGQKRLGSST